MLTRKQEAMLERYLTPYLLHRIRKNKEITISEDLLATILEVALLNGAKEQMDQMQAKLNKLFKSSK